MPTSMTWSPPGFNSTLPPAGISMPAARGRIVMMPFVMAISCNSLAGEASVVTATSRSGASPDFRSSDNPRRRRARTASHERTDGRS